MRQQLSDMATQMFVERGFDAVRVAEVAAACGVSEKTVFNYFPTKVCTDEWMLHPDPYTSREQWCWARIGITERLLAARDPALPTVLVSYFPLVREPTRILRYPEFAQWCGTERTADWHIRFNANAVVYGHLHIPGTSRYDGVRFEEVSLGDPREWQARQAVPRRLRQILPVPDGLRQNTWATPPAPPGNSG